MRCFSDVPGSAVFAGIAVAQIGDLVGETTVLANVSQLDPIKVSFPIGENEYLRFAKRINESSRSGDRSRCRCSLRSSRSRRRGRSSRR